LSWFSSSKANAAQDAAQTASLATPRIAERIDENHLAALKGNTRPEARAEFDRGPVEPSFSMSGMLLVLRRSPEQEAAAEAYAAGLTDSASPNYHHWLTASEQGEKFGPAQSDIDTITSWLLNHGFTVEGISRNRLTIRFSGNATQVEAAFHTQIHNLNVNGISHVANMSDPRIPSALTPVVVGVEALHNFFPHPLHKLGAQVHRNAQTGKWERISAPPRSTASAPAAKAGSKSVLLPQFNTGGTTSGGVANIEDVVPYDFAAIYNVLPLWNAGTPIDGAGQKIAIVATSDINPADITTFRSAFGLPAYASATGSTPGLSVIHPNTAPGDCPTADSSCVNDLIENTLDVEWAGAIAKNASIVLVASSSGTGSTFSSDPVYTSANYIIENNIAKIMNVSYGECELGLGTSGNASYNTLWQTAYIAGIAVFVASGDEGSASCDAGGDAGGLNIPYGAQFGLSVSGVASTPYNTAVGGTDFNWAWVTNGQATYWNTSNDATTLASAKGYIPEAPWNGTCTNPFLVASLNSANSFNLTATEWCDDIGTGFYTFGADENFFLSLVDTVGGSGGVSSCTTNDTTSTSTTFNPASCSGGYAKPGWQTGVPGIPADSRRDIPDISFFAASGFSGSAYVICVSNPGVGTCSYTAGTEPTGEEVGGTSVGSPAMAGVMALINQKTGRSQGNPNAVLYQIAAQESYSGCSTESVPLTGSTCSFNDIDSGTIAMPCDVGISPDCTGTDIYGVLNGYDAAAGFDLATGLGSLNVANVVNAFSAAAASTFSLSSTSLTFDSTQVGQSAATQSVTVTNSESNAVAITGITITGADASSFSETNNCGVSVPAISSCTVTVKFTPAAGGALTATVNIANSTTSSPLTIALSGSGVVPTPAVSLTPTSLTFASTTVGVTAATQPVTLQNTGTAALSITGISITGTNASSFSQTNTCGGSVAAGASCTITVTFKPAATGALSASVSIADNATGSPQTVALTGTGAAAAAPAVSLAPTSLTFASTTVGTAAATQPVTLKNTGTAALSITGISVTGTNASSFTQTNNCGSSVAAAASCTITVTFTPAATGALSASVSIADNASGSPQTVALTGTGAAAAPPGYALTNSGKITVKAGATTGNTSTITVTPSNGFTGAVALSCAISPTAASDPATCSFASPSVTISGAAAQTDVMTVSTTAATTALNRPMKLFWPSAGGAALAMLFFFGIPARRRSWLSMLGLLAFFVSMAAVGCGGSSHSGGGGNPGTTPGTYTVTVTGTAGSATQKTTVTLTVN
jgi:subtilase family serine protease